MSEQKLGQKDHPRSKVSRTARFTADGLHVGPPVEYPVRPLTNKEDAHAKTAARHARERLKAILGAHACSFAEMDEKLGNRESKKLLQSSARKWSLRDAESILSAIDACAEAKLLRADGGMNGDIFRVLQEVRDAALALLIGQRLSRSRLGEPPPDYSVAMLYEPDAADYIAATFARYLADRGLISGARKTRFDRARIALSELLKRQSSDDHSFRDKCRWAFWASLGSWKPAEIEKIEKRMDALRRGDDTRVMGPRQSGAKIGR